VRGVDWIRTAALAAAALSLGLVLTACGTKVIKSSGAEHSVVSLVNRQTGFRPADVRCPGGVDAKVAVTFKCHFTGPGGRRYTAFMRVQKVQGRRVLFVIRTRPTG
jgi:uncharacterized protein DUF4333